MSRRPSPSVTPPVSPSVSASAVWACRSLALAAATVVALAVGCRTRTSSAVPRMDLPNGEPATPATMPSQAAAATTGPATTQAAATTRVAATRPASLADRLTSILSRKRDTGAIFTARVLDADTGREIYAYDAGRPVAPASNMKLTVTSAALDFLGPEAQLETRLLVVGQDLWLVGTGDPAAGDEAIEKQHGRVPTSCFDDWAAELRARGVTSLAGNLYYVDTAFERQQLHPTWDASERVEDYAAPIGGLNFNGNCVDAVAYPTAPGQPAKVVVNPPTSSTLVLKNESVTAPAGTPDAKQTVDIKRAVDQNTYTVTGTVVKETPLDSKPVTDPGAFFADALRTHLAAEGITIAGATVRADATPDDSTATTQAVPLKPHLTAFTDVLARINKNSQNTFAEGTAKYLGRAFAQQADRNSKAVGSWENAEKAIRAFLAKNGIDDHDYRFVDGSGLSRDNRVTTRLLSLILLTMHHHAYAETFRNSMTIGGVDGSIRNRFKDLPNRVYAKTGYIGGVRSLSGYAKTDSGKWLIFSIIYNNMPRGRLADAKPFEALQDEAVRTLMSDPSVQ